MLLERGDKVRIFDNMFRGDRDKVAELVDGTATSSSSTRTSATAAPSTRAMKGC